MGSSFFRFLEVSAPGSSFFRFREVPQTIEKACASGVGGPLKNPTDRFRRPIWVVLGKVLLS